MYGRKKDFLKYLTYSKMYILNSRSGLIWEHLVSIILVYLYLKKTDEEKFLVDCFLKIQTKQKNIIPVPIMKKIEAINALML
jgi:hypothetical protein